jgi:hypothetical protein
MVFKQKSEFKHYYIVITQLKLLIIVKSHPYDRINSLSWNELSLLGYYQWEWE